jgi:apolipoprotein N-acyltransferase
MNRIGLTAYRIFVLALANLLGGGIHSTIQRGPGWFSDPVRWVRGGVERPGSVHPFFMTSGLLFITSVVALALLWRYRGAGRRGVLVTLLGSLAVLAITFSYFVPTSNAIFAEPARLSDAQIIFDSRLWVPLDVLRQLIMTGFLYLSLVTLGRVERVP